MSTLSQQRKLVEQPREEGNMDCRPVCECEQEMTVCMQQNGEEDCLVSGFACNTANRLQEKGGCVMIDIDHFKIYPFGSIGIHRVDFVGQIEIHIPGSDGSNSVILDEKELLAVRWFHNIIDNGTHVTNKIRCLIYPSGKISVYYEDVPTKISEGRLLSIIKGNFRCQTNKKHLKEYQFPVKWIKSGTLVEYEPIGKLCAKHNSTRACQNASTSNMSCIWCERAKTCIESNDRSTHQLKVNDCRIEVSTCTDGDYLCTPTPIKHIETTSGITEVQNMTNQINKENNQDKSFQYLYIVIPLIIACFVVYIGYAIWKWLYKKKKSSCS
ncbi:hypothetical protein MS3_00010560 [Schistosoma haematobium]|uniref:Egg protein CP391S-like protein n=1 Tax=Schistosoma haematobium TaxID=6185 RepID=A0A922LIQ9_SCHHA|nr:hypothetical protein MS3_00010560 [Schistosoma haematobium]KAH9586887.1 hypothetical protein MS3_00010560 [Schistosoma haematobium]